MAYCNQLTSLPFKGLTLPAYSEGMRTVCIEFQYTSQIYLQHMPLYKCD